MFWEGDLERKMVEGRIGFVVKNDRTVIEYDSAWEEGRLRHRFKKRPFPFWRVWIAKYREKRRHERAERERWAEKMRMKAERKKNREEKALAELKALEAMKNRVTSP